MCIFDSKGAVELGLEADEYIDTKNINIALLREKFWRAKGPS